MRLILLLRVLEEVECCIRGDLTPQQFFEEVLPQLSFSGLNQPGEGKVVIFVGNWGRWQIDLQTGRATPCHLSAEADCYLRLTLSAFEALVTSKDPPEGSIQITGDRHLVTALFDLFRVPESLVSVRIR